MKKLFSISFIFLGFFMTISCSSKNTPDISGKWISQVKFKTALPEDINNPDGPECGGMFSTQTITLEIPDLDSHNFKQTLKSSIDRFEYTTKKPDYLNEDEFSEMLSTEYILQGNYSIKGKYVEFLPETVTQMDGSVVKFEDFAEINEMMMQFAGYKEIELAEDKSTLSLGATKYKKAE